MAKTMSPALEQLLAEPRLPELGPGHADQSRRGELERRIPDAIRSCETIADEEMGRACMAGLWLHFDFLDESHKISQQIDRPEGSYWHGVMHRREGDFANASYWFRRAGALPFFAKLGEEAAQLLVGQAAHPQFGRLAEGVPWDPYRFVDICKASANGPSATQEVCKKLQLLEWQHLFEHTFDQASEGKTGSRTP